MWKAIVKAWCGEQKFWKVFWSLVLYFIIANALLVGFASVSSPVDKPIAGVLSFILGVLNAIVFFYSSFALWRCRYNVELKIWGHLYTLWLGILIVINLLISPFILSIFGASALTIIIVEIIFLIPAYCYVRALMNHKRKARYNYYLYPWSNFICGLIAGIFFMTTIFLAFATLSHVAVAMQQRSVITMEQIDYLSEQTGISKGIVIGFFHGQGYEFQSDRATND